MKALLQADAMKPFGLLKMEDRNTTICFMIGFVTGYPLNPTSSFDREFEDCLWSWKSWVAGNVSN
ncbi:hypothetical protein KXD40_004911 [Peronospora effusa]|nr:hypothetical protein KXD40_004911 [Peronospora effusa]